MFHPALTPGQSVLSLDAMSIELETRIKILLTGIVAASSALACVTDSPTTGADGGGGGNGGSSADAGNPNDATTACPVGPNGAPQGFTSALCSTSGLSTNFTWISSGPLLRAVPDAKHPIVSVKDPTVVFFNNRWHIYATTADTSKAWSMVYLSFADWSQAASASEYYLDANPSLRGYHCAPQLFYFSPQQKWYLVYQSQPPTYSTADDPGKPETWTAPKPFFASEPAIVTANKGSGTWLDFWVICDATNCHMFFSDDNGHWYRSQTTVASFPQGFGEPVMAMKDTKANLFEASNVYKIKGSDQYLAMIEAFGPGGQRYFRSFTAGTLDGEWTPLAATWASPFAGQNNVTFDTCASAWTQDISHGELLRDGYDETMTIDPCNLRFLYQGVAVDQRNNSDYSQIPYQLGLLTQTN